MVMWNSANIAYFYPKCKFILIYLANCLITTHKDFLNFFLVKIFREFVISGGYFI